jgi:ADP-ribosylglycohydrolase
VSDNGDAMVLGAFVGDSLALGAHWIYDIQAIRDRFGVVDRLMDPPEGGFHPNRRKGQQTHYGDQTLWLLEHLTENGRFDAVRFSAHWQSRLGDYDGYRDKATKTTLANLAAGIAPEAAGSTSDDLSAAARIAPLVHRYRSDPRLLRDCTRAQTVLTHNNAQVIEISDFFADLLLKVLDGDAPSAVMRSLLRERYANSPLAELARQGLDSRDVDTGSAIARFGQSCAASAGFPSVVHLVDRYEEDYRQAMIANVMAGGDSAARGMAVGMVLGAHLGAGAIPERWLSEMGAIDRLTELLGRLNRMSTTQNAAD